ncbi:RNA pseudouridylate synthase-like protein [Phytophthora infestans T30-4]|uniref:RNA pseudouridylate synthase-like protein n=1 Tax=Phytophthora infestans (strain T30-4) TaxID=403677 RepID=D0NJP5_PHYIT|nr:RNA pseudouridylate synthase-like protein [Phytophthora infestans T30-4]EEY59981.1 RNA pseudouridylate synthase-like protein [Phytophthora infestans T30-4]|eukprot:XP_002900666.1 RNA pseudouridylate synthase-like protein [Phytophthora infestans T30-4]
MTLRLTRYCRLPLRSWRAMSTFSSNASISAGHLPEDQPPLVPVNSATNSGDNERGGPKTQDQLHLRVLSRDEHFVVLNKGPDVRMDGAFDVTLEKALARDFPQVEKFRWIHQLDFATSGVLVVGVNKDATATGCRLFREKQVQKEYLAVVRGHLPFNPAESVDTAALPAKACTFSKLGLLIQDMEEMERLRNQQRGSRAHQKTPGYPRGVRHGPNLFTMEQAQLLPEARELTPAELAFTKMTWHDLTKEEKGAYTEKAKADKRRFLKEFSEFLNQEKIRLARKRKYESFDGEDSEEANEPVAYVFDAPVIEPHRSTGVFRMLVGTETDTAAKQSTTMCFVLGHAIYKGEPVTKVLLRPLNGRRHQLRLHMAHHGFPIAGDVTYGSQEDEAPRMMLHAWRIWLRGRPADQKKYGDLYFESPDPFDLIVPSEREVCTITYHKHKEQKAAEASKESSSQST